MRKVSKIFGETDINARDLIRKNEEEFKKSGLTLSSNEQAPISAMAKSQKL